jgi:hypothetical protein
MFLARAGAREDVAANSRTSGRLDGSIIAAIITCHASRNASVATAGGGPSTSSAS